MRPSNGNDQRLPRYVIAVHARGKSYYYFRVERTACAPGRKIRIPGDPYLDDTTPNPAWWDFYRRVAGMPSVTQPERYRAPGTIGSLIASYRSSPNWHQNHGERTRQEWGRHLSKIDELWGTLPARSLTSQHVFRLRDVFAATPAQANNMIKALSSMLSWAADRGVVDHNPIRHRRNLKLPGGDPYLPWSWEEIRFFELAARPELTHAMFLALYTGQRLGDVLSMEWEQISERGIGVRSSFDVHQQKTKKHLVVPIHAELDRALQTIPRRSAKVLTTSKGRDWNTNNFGTAWQRQMNMPEFTPLRARRLVFHGLRKSAVVMLLEAGCTDAEVAAITGQSREMIDHYATAVNQKRLASSAILKWEQDCESRRS